MKNIASRLAELSVWSVGVRLCEGISPGRLGSDPTAIGRARFLPSIECRCFIGVTSAVRILPRARAFVPKQYTSRVFISIEDSLAERSEFETAGTGF